MKRIGGGAAVIQTHQHGGVIDALYSGAIIHLFASLKLSDGCTENTIMRPRRVLLLLSCKCWVKMAIIQEIFDFAVLDEQTG